MAYYSKYTGAELEERLDKVEEIPQLIAQMITGKDFVTKEDLLCVLRDYAPATYATIPIDNNTIYWENGVLKAATSDGGGQCQWELREHNGIQYLYSRLPVVTQYDVTMYADVNHLDLPSIYDGLPIDGDTIYWEETENGRILKSKYEGSSGVDASEVLSIVSGAGYATQNWVNNQSFITQSYLATELLKYVTLDNYQEIIGVKNFINGLQISNIPIKKLEGYDDILYIDSNVVIRGGLTMYYEDGEINLPSIKEEIGNAGYDGVTGLASFDSSQFSISSDGTVTIIGGSAGLDTAQLKDYLDSNKYTTETWVKEQGYASASSLSSLQIKVNNFLEGSDTDTIINKWKELEVFLSGLSESDNLATILSTKWTTDNDLINQWNTAYGWGDHSKVGYALKSYVDGELAKYVTLGTKQTITGEKNFTGGLKVNGSPIYYDATNKYWKLEGDLLVTGGVSMYSDDTSYIPSTIMDAVVVDGVTIKKRSEDGALYFAGTMDGGVTDFWELNNIPTWIGSSKPTYTLGSLQNVDSSSIDATATVDRVLFQQAGSATWSWKALSEIGGGSGGGSVSGNYLPLSGGTINGSGSYSAIPLVIKNSNSQFNGLSIYANTTERVHLGYWSSLGGVRLENVACSAGLSILNDKTPSYYKINSDGTFVKDAILHAGNYSSYALPLSGGTIDGDILARLFKFTRTDGSNESAGYIGVPHSNNNNIGIISTTSSAIEFITSDYNVPRMIINPNGNVGIGTTSPASQLDVNGTVLSHYVRTSYNNSAGFSEYEALNYTRAWFANTQTLSVPYNSVQVALGWSNWLHGQGYHTRYTISSVRFNGWGGMSLAVGANDEGTYRGCTLELWGSGTISAGGNLTVSGGITMYSDQRKKTILNHVELSLKQIADAPLIEHFYNSDQNKTTHVGSIAQYWASMNDWFCKEDAEGFYTMEIQNCALASAISIARHLEKYESKTDRTIRKMKQRIQELEDEVERLKKGA